MSFSAVGRITGLSVHRVMAICHRYVEHAVSLADHSEVKRVAIAINDFEPSAPSFFWSPENSTSPNSTRTSHNPLKIQQSQF
jgi:hypothetical protein